MNNNDDLLMQEMTALIYGYFISIIDTRVLPIQLHTIRGINYVMFPC